MSSLQVRRLYEAFHEPFRRTLQRQPAASQRPQEAAGSRADPEASKAAVARTVTEDIPLGNDWISDEEEGFD